MRRKKAEKLVDKYFDNCGYILFGDYDLSRPDRRALAKEWFLDLCVAVGIVKLDTQDVEPQGWADPSSDPLSDIKKALDPLGEVKLEKFTLLPDGEYRMYKFRCGYGDPIYYTIDYPIGHKLYCEGCNRYDEIVMTWSLHGSRK